ncbi:hypothetical protein BCR33DRAFT_306570 [Rhizoclosmatium globosum]|uniref:SAM domain-containing protein n=1 Tax=Rhizoclosmatium globosum TaxID=329046 RepID=A0A1Y2C5E4_9FUNG|nr:hypothetical protein BCR33DRAFT_306570 [Rhizoclosmatium globosum]|eukprot:ORY42249.1 hypothetical protein BCR33DRAFT_306570 [Rhizoclosmatium globosum]
MEALACLLGLLSGESLVVLSFSVQLDLLFGIASGRNVLLLTVVKASQKLRKVYVEVVDSDMRARLFLPGPHLGLRLVKNTMLQRHKSKRSHQDMRNQLPLILSSLIWVPRMFLWQRDEKQTSRLFTDMTEVASNIGDAWSSKYLQTTTQGDNSYTMFGDLYLPDTPSVWTVNQVVQWVQRNEGTPEILSFIQEQEIDGRALLLIREDDLAFPTVGRRMRFREALDALRRINEARVHAAAPLPSYSG